MSSGTVNANLIDPLLGVGLPIQEDRSILLLSQVGPGKLKVSLFSLAPLKRRQQLGFCTLKDLVAFSTTKQKVDHMEPSHSAQLLLFIEAYEETAVKLQLNPSRLLVTVSYHDIGALHKP